MILILDHRMSTQQAIDAMGLSEEEYRKMIEVKVIKL